MGDRKYAKKIMKVMLALLIVLILLSSAYAIYIYTFNHAEREYDSGNKCNSFNVEIAPRTGQTDSWPKIIEENGESVDYKGTIYDVTIDNIGNYSFSCTYYLCSRFI